MLKILYLGLIHVLAVVCLLKSSTIKNMFDDGPTVSRHYLQMTAFYNRIDQNLDESLNIFIGDSFIQGLAVNSVNSHSVNYGIGGDTTLGVLQRLKSYRSLINSKRVVLAIGHNDINTGVSNSADNLRMIFDYIPSNVQVIVCSVFLTDDHVFNGISNSEITELNSKIRKLVDLYPNVTYLDGNEWAVTSDRLDSNFHVGDGVHLNKQGNELWIKQLKTAFEKVKIN
jgi:lysophospholipase L1-like esterase